MIKSNALIKNQMVCLCGDDKDPNSARLFTKHRDGGTIGLGEHGEHPLLVEMSGHANSHMTKSTLSPSIKWLVHATVKRIPSLPAFTPNIVLATLSSPYVCSHMLQPVEDARHAPRS